MVLFINYIIPTSLILEWLTHFALIHYQIGIERKRASRETPLIFLGDVNSIWR